MWKLLDEYVPEFQEPPKKVKLKLPKLEKVTTVDTPEIKLPKLMKIK